MKQPGDLELRLFGCVGVASFDDVVIVAERMRDLGLVFVELVDGTNRAVDDIRTFLEARSFDFVAEGVLPAARLTSPAQERQRWGGLCAPREALHSEAGFGACCRLGNIWDLQVRMMTGMLRLQGEPLPVAVKRWAELLNRLGDELYEQVRPDLGVLFATQPSDMRERVPVFLQRGLFVGWRTWYGPAYVEAYGQDILLGLPDRAEQLDNGGVYHALDADPVDLVAGAPVVYDRLWKYLEAREIRPAWPRPPRSKTKDTRARRARPVQDDPAPRNPEELQAALRECLSTVAVLTDGTRVLMLPFPWSVLRESEQAIVFRHLLYAVQSVLTEHPDSRVRVEFLEIPSDLRELLDKTYPTGGPVSYGLLTDRLTP